MRLCAVGAGDAEIDLAAPHQMAPPQTTAARDRRPPDEAEVRNPPQWTAQQAGPPVPNAVAAENAARSLESLGKQATEAPVPPDPFEEPPMAVNPARGAAPTDPGPPWMDESGASEKTSPADPPATEPGQSESSIQDSIDIDKNDSVPRKDQ